MKGIIRQALSAPPNEAPCFSMPNPRPADGAPSLRPFLSCAPLPFQRCSAGLFCLQSRKPQGSGTTVCASGKQHRMPKEALLLFLRERRGL